MSEYHWRVHLPDSEQKRDSHEAQNRYNYLINRKLTYKNPYFPHDQSTQKKPPKRELYKLRVPKNLLKNTADQLQEQLSWLRFTPSHPFARSVAFAYPCKYVHDLTSRVAFHCREYLTLHFPVRLPQPLRYATLRFLRAIKSQHHISEEREHHRERWLQGKRPRIAVIIFHYLEHLRF